MCYGLAYNGWSMAQAWGASALHVCGVRRLIPQECAVRHALACRIAVAVLNAFLDGGWTGAADNLHQVPEQCMMTATRPHLPVDVRSWLGSLCPVVLSTTVEISIMGLA